jgi:hypothetical protein
MPRIRPPWDDQHRSSAELDAVAIGVAARLIAEQRRPARPPLLPPAATSQLPLPLPPPSNPLAGQDRRRRLRPPAAERRPAPPAPLRGGVIPFLTPRPPGPPEPPPPKAPGAPPTWAETRGWRWREDGLFVGEFRAGQARYRGEIFRTFGGYLTPYIHLPSDARCLRRGAHAPCFFPISPGYFRVHLAREAWNDNVDDIIRAVEGALG